jgi:hypothetical protein
MPNLFDTSTEYKYEYNAEMLILQIFKTKSVCYRYSSYYK